MEGRPQSSTLGVACLRLLNCDRAWYFAYQAGGHLTYGPLAPAWNGDPRFRDLQDHVLSQDRVGAIVVAIPAALDEDDLRDELRRVHALAAARFRIYTIPPADLSSALRLPAPPNAENASMTAIECFRRALSEQHSSVDVSRLEDGAVLAVAMLLAGAEAHDAWLARFGRSRIESKVVGLTEDLAARSVDACGTPEPSTSSLARRGAEEGRGLPDRAALLAAPDSALLNVQEVMSLYRLTRSVVYALQSQIPSNKFGGLRFRKGDIERHLVDHQRPPTGRSRRRTARAGTPIARRKSGGDEVVPGLTRAALKAATGL